MTNDEILDGIDSYCADNESDYAIMITGPWGSGKTYFANNKINSFLAEKGKKTAYVSLFGITKNEEIDHLVIQAVYPFVKSSIFKVGSALAQTAVKTAASLHQIDLVLPQISMPVRDIVIIFDDLERASKLIDTSDLIGYIDRYCSQRHVKCIIVCNEDEVDKSECPTSDLGETVYRMAKEKTVRYTYKYEFDLDQILAYLSDISCDEAEKTASRVIVAERNTLNTLPKDYEVNARILITAYHLVARLVVKSGHIRNENHYDDYIENVSRCILAYLIEHKNHQIGIKEIMETVQAQAMFDLSSLMQRKTGKGEENEWQTDVRDNRNIYMRISEGLFPGQKFIHLSRAAAQLAYHGGAFEKDIDEEFRDFVNKVFPERDPLTMLFWDFSLLDDVGFSNAIDSSFRRLIEDDISLSEIIQTVYFLEYFLKEGLTDAYDDKKLLQNAIASADRIFDRATSVIDQDEVARIPFLYEALGEIAKKVFDHAHEKVPQIEDQRLKQKATDDWRGLCAADNVEILYHKFGLQSEWNRNIFFGYLETGDILSGLETMSNSVKRALADMILTRYTKSPYQHIGDVFDKERDRLDTVRSLLKSEIGKSSVPVRLSLHMKNRIVEAIDKAFDKFTPPTPQPVQ